MQAKDKWKNKEKEQRALSNPDNYFSVENDVSEDSFSELMIEKRFLQSGMEKINSVPWKDFEEDYPAQENEYENGYDFYTRKQKPYKAKNVEFEDKLYKKYPELKNANDISTWQHNGKNHETKLLMNRVFPLIGSPIYDNVDENEKMELVKDMYSNDRDTLIKAYQKYRRIMYNNLKRSNNEFGLLLGQLSPMEITNKIGASKANYMAGYLQDADQITKTTDEDFNERVRNGLTEDENKEYDNLYNYYDPLLRIPGLVANGNPDFIIKSQLEGHSNQINSAKPHIKGISLTDEELAMLRKYKKL